MRSGRPIISKTVAAPAGGFARPAPPLPPPTSAPTREYHRHHVVEAPRIDDRHFHPAWRVLTRLDGLLADGAITTAEWHAAADFRDMAEFALGGAASHSVLTGARTARSVASLTADRLVARLDARSWLDEVARVIGTVPCALIKAFVVDDMSWAAIGRCFGVDPKTARAWVITSIKALATRR